jgi:hypothetical protein
LANPEHLAKLKEGVAAWNQWRQQTHTLQPDLSGANLSRAHLEEANFQYADLQQAHLTGAKLYKARLVTANLSGADLRKAELEAADLVGAKLIEANLSGANLTNADLTLANLSGANLSGASLKLTTLVQTNLEGANLTSCSVYGISAWDVKLRGTNQSNLVITLRNQSVIQVDNLEVAQFVYLLLNNEKIREVIDTIGKKAVLILGRFTPERIAVLHAIREALRHHGYLPILFNFEKPSTRDTQETIATLAGMVRFIIADITDPKSIPQELASIVPDFPSVPVQPVLQNGYEPWGMYDHIRRYPWVLPLVLYENQETLLKELELKVIVPAEAKAKEQTQR